MINLNFESLVNINEIFKICKDFINNILKYSINC